MGDLMVNHFLYYEKDSDGNIPVLIVSQKDKITIEIRAYQYGERRGCLWNNLTRDQARLLRDRLSEWLLKDPKRDE